MTKKLDSRWLSHLKGKERDEFEGFIRNAWPILERLSQIIDTMEDADAPSKKADYSNPSWAYRQADHNGYSRAMKSIKDLLEIDNA